MARRAILHIGVMKTGSSSIQAWLSRERRRLAARGVHVPLGNMSFLATTAIGKPEGPRARQSFQRQDRLLKEVADLPPDIHTVVLSGEALGQHLHTEARVAYLKTVLDTCFSEYLVVVYLRRQDQQSISYHAYSLRRGQPRILLRSPMDYAAMLDAWSGVFGADAVRPRVFERQSLVAGDAVADFAEVTGLGPMGEPLIQGNVNPSNRPAAQMLLQALFKAATHDGGLTSSQFVSSDGFRAFMRELDANYAGTGALPTRGEARAFYESCRDANERVRRSWFPERRSLFDEDFGRYPEEPQPQPGRDEILEISAKMLGKLLLSPVWGQSKARAVPDEALADEMLPEVPGGSGGEGGPGAWRATVREERKKARAEIRQREAHGSSDERRARERAVAGAPPTS